MSRGSGSFTSFTNIGTLTSDANSGTISATIPAGTTTGSAYRIRVVSNPGVTGTDNWTNLTINLPAISVSPSTTQNINAAVNGATLTVTESPAATSRVWATSTTSGGPYTNTASIGTDLLHQILQHKELTM